MRLVDSSEKKKMTAKNRTGGAVSKDIGKKRFELNSVRVTGQRLL